MAQISSFPSDLLKGDKKNTIPQPPNISAVYITRNFLGRVVQVGVTPTLIHDATRAQNIMLMNPARAFGSFPVLTGLHTAQVAIAAGGNTQAAPLGVANYLDMHLFLNITAIAAGTTWSFYNMVQDPFTLTWVDSQPLATGITPAIVATWTNAELYNTVGMFGIASQYAIRWTLDGGAGAITFTLSYALKQGTIGSAAGIPQVIYIGSNPGITVTSGYPLFESSEKVFQVAEGTQLYGVAQVATNINVFELT